MPLSADAAPSSRPVFLPDITTTTLSLMLLGFKDTMDINCDEKQLHLPIELLIYICGFLQKPSDACAARLVNRAFCTAATLMITDLWHLPSLLFVNPHPSFEPKPYEEFLIDPYNQGRWIEKPVTIWTWMHLPTSVTLEDTESSSGRRFAQLLCAPDDGPRWTNYYVSYNRYGRKGVSWGRAHEFSNLFCIVIREFASC